MKNLKTESRDSSLIAKSNNDSHSEGVKRLKNLNMKDYYVYIMTNKSRTLYTGVTNNLSRRVFEHKNKLIEGFTKKYNIDKLVYFEIFNNPDDAIRREKQIKGWLRKKKIDLIESLNPQWKDLSNGF